MRVQAASAIETGGAATMDPVLIAPSPLRRSRQELPPARPTVRSLRENRNAAVRALSVSALHSEQVTGRTAGALETSRLPK